MRTLEVMHIRHVGAKPHIVARAVWDSSRTGPIRCARAGPDMFWIVDRRYQRIGLVALRADADGTRLAIGLVQVRPKGVAALSEKVWQGRVEAFLSAVERAAHAPTCDDIEAA